MQFVNEDRDGIILLLFCVLMSLGWLRDEAPRQARCFPDCASVFTDLLSHHVRRHCRNYFQLSIV